LAFSIEQTLLPLPRHLEGRARHARDLAFGVALGVDADALVALGMDAARLAEIDAGGQLADDHDVEAGDHVLLQRREIGQRVEALGRAQVGVEVHLLAQAQEPTLGLHGEVEHVVFRPAHGAQQDRVDLLRLGHRRVGERRAVGVIGRAADEVLADVEGDALRAEPVDDLAHLGHDLGADPVAGQDEQ
jgi:hypothetical protein